MPGLRSRVMGLGKALDGYLLRIYRDLGGKSLETSAIHLGPESLRSFALTYIVSMGDPLYI